MDGTKRYELRLSLAWRALFLGAGLLSLSMVADAFEAGDAFTIGTSLAFFGFGGLVLLKVMLRNSGIVELRDEGVLLDSYLTTGFVPWENFQSAQSVRAFGVKYLGISLGDPAAYIASRKEVAGLKHDRDRALAGGFVRVMMALLQVLPPARTGCNLLLTVLGYAPLPKAADEASLMEWTHGSYGSHLLIHKMWVPEFEALIDDMNQHARPAPVQQPLLSTGDQHTDRRTDEAHQNTPQSALKNCPMCAEQVQPAARICRYCRYSFEDERFLPAAS